MTWHILTTAPGRERAAAKALAVRGAMVFAPLVRLSRRRIMAMFPGYLFTRLDAPAERALAELSGLRVMHDSNVKVTLADAAIEEIRATAALHAETWRQPFRHGDLVVVSEDGGPWQGVRGIVARLDGHDKVVVQALLPGTASRISVNSQWLEPASEGPRKRSRAASPA